MSRPTANSMGLSGYSEPYQLLAPSRRERKIASALNRILDAHHQLLDLHKDNLAQLERKPYGGVDRQAATELAQLCDQLGRAYSRLAEDRSRYARTGR